MGAAPGAAMSKVLPFLRRLRSLDEFPDPPKAGWAGQWDRHRWPMPPHKSAPRRISLREIGFMVIGGALLGLAGAAIMAASSGS